MLTDSLQRAQTAIERQLREEGKPMNARELFQSIDEEGVREIDLREAVWLLIGKGKIRLNWDRRLELADEAESEVVAD